MSRRVPKNYHFVPKNYYFQTYYFAPFRQHKFLFQKYHLVKTPFSQARTVNDIVLHTGFIRASRTETFMSICKFLALKSQPFALCFATRRGTS